MEQEQGILLLDNTEVPYILHRSAKRRKTLGIAVNPQNGLVLTAPIRWHLSDIHQMLQRSTRWIFKQLERLQKEQFEVPTFVHGEAIPYLGSLVHLHVAYCKPKRTRYSCLLEGNNLNIHLPLFVEETEKSRYTKHILCKWLKAQATLILKERIDIFAAEMNLSYQKLIIGNQKKRWGSCDTKGIIRLNWRLILAPLELIDYVVVHELCHLVHHNHQPRFWALVEKYLPDHKIRRKELRDRESMYLNIFLGPLKR